MKNLQAKLGRKCEAISQFSNNKNCLLKTIKRERKKSPNQENIMQYLENGCHNGFNSQFVTNPLIFNTNPV